MSSVWFWMHRDNSSENTFPSGVYGIVVNENFNITKGVLQTAIPNETDDSSTFTDQLDKGTFVMFLGGSKKTLQIHSVLKASDFESVVNLYNQFKDYVNNIEIGAKLVLDVYLGVPGETGSVNIYSYNGVLSSITFNLKGGTPSILEITVTFYVGQVLG